MKFGEMLEHIRNGENRATRMGWNGKNMYIYVEKGKIIKNEQLRDPIKTWLGTDDMFVQPHINMRDAKGLMVVGWLASQTDMLADDWVLV